MPVNFNLAGHLTASAQRTPDAPALRLGAAVLTYRELDDASARVADQLRMRGLAPGDRVGVMLPNAPQFAYVYYGVLRAGGVVVPMSVALRRREVSHCLSDSGARLVYAWHDIPDFAIDGATQSGADCIVLRPGSFEELVDNVPTPDRRLSDRDAGDTAAILYTSGTTGAPKGAELTHANLRRNAEVSVRVLGVTASDVILGALPLFHSFGQTCGLNASVLAGALLTLVPEFDSTLVLARIERDRVTILPGVPEMYAALLNDPSRERRDCSSLRVCVCGGTALPVEILHAFEAAFDRVVLEGYGLSETSPVACFNHAPAEREPGSIGRPVEGVEMCILDPEDGLGEIAVRGHNVMKGYWRAPEATADAIDSDGWLRTGDIGRVDEHGRFYVLDRKQDVIVRGGCNVYPLEIEGVLREHDAVQEAAVIGRADRELGEEVCAAVVLRTAGAAEPSELGAFVRERVAARKYPRHIWIVDELPKTPTGKVRKREIEVPDSVLNARYGT